MRRPIRNVQEWSGDPRSIGLLALAVVYVRVAVTFMPWADGYRTTALPDILELIAPGAVYVICGVWFLSTALVVYIAVAQVSVRRPIRWMLALTVAMPTCWGSIYAVSWFAQGRVTLELSTGILYWALALITGCFIAIPPARLYVSTWPRRH